MTTDKPTIDDVVLCLEWAIEKLDKLGEENAYTLGMVRSLNHCKDVADYARKNLLAA